MLFLFGAIYRVSVETESLTVSCSVDTGRLPMPVAAHLTPKGGWVEFNQSGAPTKPSGESSNPNALMLPTLRPLAWFRFSTAQEHTMLQSHLEAEIEMHGREMEFLHNHELPWWLGDADIHQVADHWRGKLCLLPRFVCLLESQVAIDAQFDRGLRHSLDLPDLLLACRWICTSQQVLTICKQHSYALHALS